MFGETKTSTPPHPRSADCWGSAQKADSAIGSMRPRSSETQHRTSQFKHYMKRDFARSTLAWLPLLLISGSFSLLQATETSSVETSLPPKPIVISPTTTNKRIASNIIKLAHTLNASEMNDISSVRKHLADLQALTGESEFGKLATVKKYLLYWDLSTGNRGGTIEEVGTKTDTSSAKKVKSTYLGTKIDGNVNGVGPVVKYDLHGSGEAGYRSESTITTNSYGNRTITFNGTVSDPSLRMLREEARVAMCQDLRQLGFGRVPTPNDLIGKWSWPSTGEHGAAATIVVQLDPDFTLNVQGVTDDAPGLFNGRGTWSLADCTLTITMQRREVMQTGLFKGWKMMSQHIVTDTIEWFDSDQIVLTGKTQGASSRVLDRIH